METDEAPEKIWAHELSARELDVPLKDYHIEYTRTDAFIKKACEWLRNHSDEYIWYNEFEGKSGMNADFIENRK